LQAVAGFYAASFYYSKTNFTKSNGALLLNEILWVFYPHPIRRNKNISISSVIFFSTFKAKSYFTQNNPLAHGRFSN
jgi:hypothetical protein